MLKVTEGCNDSLYRLLTERENERGNDKYSITVLDDRVIVLSNS